MNKVKIVIFTQNEKLYLPLAIAAVVKRQKDDISCIILAAPMSTHGGKLKGMIRHLPVFGVKGTLIMAAKLAIANIGERLHLPKKPEGHWSIGAIGKQYGIPVYHVGDVNSEVVSEIIRKHPSDLLVSVSCPQIIKPHMIEKFSRGAINVHSAPLPKYRGLMPAFWVLLNNEPETAVTVHFLADKLDNGEILYQEPVTISRGETWDSLVTKTKKAAGNALNKTISLIAKDEVEPKPNNDANSTYFGFPTAADARNFRAAGKEMF